MTGPTPDEATTGGALLMRVPGHSKPRKAALKEYQEFADVERKRYKPVFRFLVPSAHEVYRWRVQLDCGCVREMLTRDEDIFPDSRAWKDPITECELPLGELWCPNDHGRSVKPYHEIVEWLKAEVSEFPADPEECPYEEISADQWSKIGEAEPYSIADWHVRLSCGHVVFGALSAADWQPENGLKSKPEEWVDRARSKFEAGWSEESGGGWPEEGPEREHFRRMLDLGWPEPKPEAECRTCLHTRRITGYQRIGWLVPRADSKKVAEAQEAAEREKAERRLAKIEAEAARLREQLGRNSD